MNYIKIEDCDAANHEGFSVTIFVAGCNKRCSDCFSPNTWDFKAGVPFTSDTIDMILEKLKPDYIKGLTLLGGDPLEPENVEDIARLVRTVRVMYHDTKDIWCYSGYTLEQLEARTAKDESLQYILDFIDVLVDGPFIAAMKDLTLAFRGSSNQRLIDMKATNREGKVVLWQMKE